MGFDCRAGWPELQNYRAAKANLWLWQHPELSRLHVWWEAKGFTDKSGAAFYVGLGDMSNDSPDEAHMSYPISCPSKVNGNFRFLTGDHARRLKSQMERFSAETEMMKEWRDKAAWSIEVYEGVKAPLGSPAWLGLSPHVHAGEGNDKPNQSDPNKATSLPATTPVSRSPTPNTGASPKGR